MKNALVATIVLFCAILVGVWYLSEQAHPVMIQVDAAQHQHR
jgi:hypothetical protein